MTKLEDFVNTGISHRGMGWTQFQSWAKGIGTGAHLNAWCADFVCACAKVNGILDNIIYRSASARTIVQETGKMGEGFFVNKRDNYTPKMGDLIWFNWTGRGLSGAWGNDHVGIITSYKDGRIETIEGNTSNSVNARSYSISSNNVVGFGAPNWAAAGDGSGASIWGSLYSTRNTREDAIVREVAYEQDNKLTVSPTRDKMSVGNYTDVMAELFDWGKVLLTPVYNVDNVEGNAKIVIEFFMGKGLNAAASCGIAGNIERESNFRTNAVGDYGTSFGICQWHYGRGDRMKQFCGGNWQNNLTGQLEYLWYELNFSYGAVMSVLNSVPNNEEGCRRAADVFVRKFEIPANVNNESNIRQNNALKYFNSIAIGIKGGR